MTSSRSPLGLNEQEVARYVSPYDLRQRFRDVEFSIPPGTVFLLFRERELQRSWEPGTHQWPKSLFETVIGAIWGVPPPLRGWWVRTAPITAGPGRLSEGYSRDGLPFVATLALRVQASDPLRLIMSMGWGKDAIAAADVLAVAAPHAEAVVEAHVRASPAEALADPSGRAPLEQAIVAQLGPVLQQRGLVLLGMAHPLRLTCPTRDQQQRIKAEYEALTTRTQATAEGKHALDEFLVSDEREQVRLEAERAGVKEDRTKVFGRVQAIIVQMAQEEALTEGRLEEVRRQADRAHLLSEEDWRRFRQEIELAREKDGFQKHAAAEIARMEAEHSMEETRLRREGQLNQLNQELQRQQREEELRWRVRQARLEEEASTARVEAQQQRESLRLLDEQRRLLESQQRQDQAQAAREEARRQREAAEAAHRRALRLEEERAALEMERLRAMHDLEVRARAREQEASVRDRETDRRTNTLRQVLQAVRENVGVEPALVVGAFVVSYPEERETLRELNRFVYTERMGEGKVALMMGRKEEFITWAEKHYGALGEALKGNAASLRTVDDVLAVLDRFLGVPEGGRPGARRPAAQPQDWGETVRRVGPSVVPVHVTRYPEGRLASGFGTAFVVGLDGQPLLATSAHLFGSLEPALAEQSVCLAYLGDRSLAAEVLLWDAQRDLALLRPLEARPLQPLALAQATPSPGERVGVLGFPLGATQPLRRSRPRFSEGVVAGLWQGSLTSSVLHITAPINPGNSGGPILLADGKVVGVVASSLHPPKDSPMPPTQGMNFGVQAAQLAAVLEGARPLLGGPARWAAQRTADGLLLLRPPGHWEVTSASNAPLRIMDPAGGVEVAAVPVQAASPQEALAIGLRALGCTLGPQEQVEVVPIDYPYWSDWGLLDPAGVQCAVLRWEPGDGDAGRGLVALGRPVGSPAEAWQDHVRAIMGCLYLA